MQAATDCQHLQTTLRELTEFLGQTYITTCEEVARAEYAVQSSMQIVQDLRAQLSAQRDTVADESPAPTMPAPSVSKLAPGAGHTSNAEVAVNSASPSNAQAANPAAAEPSAPSTQHAKLQAVLAQARAIRGQDKPQPSTLQSQSVSQAGKAKLGSRRPLPNSTARVVSGQRNSSSSMHDRTNRPQAGAQASSSRASRASKPGLVSTKSHVDATAYPSKPMHHKQVYQQVPAKAIPERDTASLAQLPEMQVQQQQMQHGVGSHAPASLAPPPAAADQSTKAAPKHAQTTPLQMPAHFRRALKAFRQMPSQQQAQSAAGSNTTASRSTEPFVNLTDTYNSSMTAIGEAGRAFHDRLSARARVEKSTTQEWANPEAQRWLRHRALVEAQLMLMQRLSNRLDAQPADGSEDTSCSSAEEDAWQETVQLWQEVQQEYHALFEMPAADTDAVMRWRNRALRFVLTPQPDAPGVTDRHAGPKHRAGCAANKPAEAWLPEACWGGLPPSLQLPPCSTSAPGTAKFGPSSILLPQGKSVGTSGATTIEYTSLAQLQTLSRLQHQLQLYLWQHHIESTLAAPLMPPDSSAEPQQSQMGSEPHQQMLAQIRLAHAFLCKGAERGLCTMTQEHIQ